MCITKEREQKGLAKVTYLASKHRCRNLDERNFRGKRCVQKSVRACERAERHVNLTAQVSAGKITSMSAVLYSPVRFPGKTLRPFMDL